jgi:Zn-dependent protease/predicted transcriptional regulator
MRWSWKIGEIAGIAIYIHATFWLLILFILYEYWTQDHSLARALAGVIFVMAIFGCIVLHELGHALTARHYGIRTSDVTLLPIGGLARLEKMPDVPMQEFWVALAGPAVNVLIATVLWVFLVINRARPDWSRIDLVGGGFLNRLMVVNLWLVAFNLIPAFPMDGGRVLRALLATKLEYTQATQVAARIGQAIAFFFGLIGLFTDPFLVFIALFVWLGAEQESAMVQMHTSLGGIPVQRVMLTEFHRLSPDDPLSRAVELTMAGGQQDFPVVFGDHVLGVLSRSDVVRELAQHGQAALVRDAMNRDFPTADSHDMLEKALAALHGANSRAMPVVHDDRLVGLLTMDNIGEFMMIQAALRRANRSARIL